MSESFRVYVDRAGALVSEVGDYLREATEAEVREGNETSEGFIDTHSDVAPRLYRNEEDGTTHARSLPEGLTAESAYYAMDGPRDQRIAQLKGIIDALEDWENVEAVALRQEAEEYLDDVEGA